jgi:hypothetical protein
MAVDEQRAVRSVTIRPLAEADLAAAGALFLRRLRKPGIVTAEEAGALLRRTLLDDPWADAAIPPLVAEAPGGAIVGLIGASVRHVRLDGEPLRVAYASHLVADREFHNRTVGLFLLRAFLRGEQDASLTDTATPQARALWVALGSTPIHHLNTGWFRILRPAGAAAALGRRRGGSAALAARALGGVSPLVDRLARSLAGKAAGSCADVSDEVLTPAAALEELARLTDRARLVPDYDEAYLRWLFAELARDGARGVPQLRLVRARGGVIGWYVYYLRPGGLCRVLQVVCRERNADAVVGALHRHAYQGGAAALYGRLEPRTSEAVLRLGARLRPSPRAVVHSRNDAIVAALQQGSSALSWLDGEPW